MKRLSLAKPLIGVERNSMNGKLALPAVGMHVCHGAQAGSFASIRLAQGRQGAVRSTLHALLEGGGVV